MVDHQAFADSLRSHGDAHWRAVVAEKLAAFEAAHPGPTMFDPRWLDPKTGDRRPTDIYPDAAVFFRDSQSCREPPSDPLQREQLAVRYCEIALERAVKALEDGKSAVRHDVLKGRLTEAGVRERLAPLFAASITAKSALDQACAAPLVAAIHAANLEQERRQREESAQIRMAEHERQQRLLAEVEKFGLTKTAPAKTASDPAEEHVITQLQAATDHLDQMTADHLTGKGRPIK